MPSHSCLWLQIAGFKFKPFKPLGVSAVVFLEGIRSEGSNRINKQNSPRDSNCGSVCDWEGVKSTKMSHRGSRQLGTPVLGLCHHGHCSRSSFFLAAWQALLRQVVPTMMGWRLWRWEPEQASPVICSLGCCPHSGDWLTNWEGALLYRKAIRVGKEQGLPGRQGAGASGKAGEEQGLPGRQARSS